ncbi:hypothetical protein QTI99_14605 [Clostridium perfringens]|uniref:hypothetical protein n=1 Tax=Clostridium perfringens TaxID=1502 RepID=UPI002ED5EB81|nr:hypothetical protein [Clostridium perfringens]WVM77544.1 hypothetical protein V1680_15580 [Clostridium perfringens]
MLKKLFLDLNNFKSNLGSVERGDSIELNIKLLNDEDYSRSKFRLLGAKSDGKSVEQIEGLNLEEKDLKVVLEDQFVNCEGIVKLELNVVSGETEITTKEFYFFVSNTMNAEIIDSADSIPTLEKVSKYVDDAVNNLDALKEASEDITIINSEFKENEIKRKANEMLREKNEKARLQSEDIRITEEEEREANELERIQAENDRKVAENNRKLAENTRKTNEAARVEAELNRQSLFEENEEIRNSNENLRIASEKERIEFNSEAKTDELNRKEAEKNRVLAEEERKSSEESRVAAEAIRQNTYTDFNDSEVERKNNEIKREEAEALRVEAETRRDNLFSEKEEERNTSFIESEKVRNAAFNKAQDSRNTTFEESETVREEAFKISEKARNDAEELRVTAERERVKSEKLRVDSEKARVLAEEERNTTFTQKEEERNNTFTQNETNRNDTFTQNEEERQGIFEEAENARKVAESKRVKSESSRAEAEKVRVSAETRRVEAENLRVTAEEERVAAETKREEGFNKFEGKINANTEELKNARSATTGEKFNSLNERIDCEVDRLNKKIEVSLLQQEDKESHTVENTIDGMTTDMCIKGRTLQNLCVLPNKDYMVIENTTYSLGKNFKPSTKYMLICDIKDSQSLEITDKTTYLRVDDKTGVVIGGYVGNVTNNYNRITFEFTTLENITGDLYLRQRLSLGTQQIIKNIVILEFDERYKNIPYFEGIKSFGEAEGNKISILSQNDNFINDISLGILNVGNGQESDSNTYFRSGFIKNIINNYYIRTENNYIVTNVFEYDENRNFIKQNTISGATNFKVTSKYFRIVGRKQDSTTITDSLYKNIVVGSKIYDKYFKSQQDKKDILLNQYGFENGLNGINDINDELNSIRNVAIKKINKYINSNNETINIHTIRNNTISFNYNFIRDTPKGKNSNPNIMTNCFETNISCYSNDVEGCFGTPSGFFGSVLKTKLESQDINGIAKYVRENFKECYYELAEPVETPLDENINLKTFGERTYVSFENAISGTSSFKAPVDSATTISRLNRENRALEEENKTLRQDFESTTLSLTDSDLELVKQNVDMDFRLMEVEFALDIPQAILSSDIKFKNKKGEVKSMARTPYEMMKIVILSGDYDREDYMHKVGKYYERGRMTKEEHDELMSLMTADEVISK